MAARNTNSESDIAPAADAKPVASDGEKEKEAAAAAAVQQAHPLKGLFVSYTGPKRLAAAAEDLKRRDPVLGEGTTAVINPGDWPQGIKCTRVYEWKLSNQWRIAAVEFTAEQLEYLFRVSTRFELVNEQGEKVDR